MSPTTQVVSIGYIALCALAGFMDYLNMWPF